MKTYMTLDEAIALVSKEFIGVKDKGGDYYILHCLEVMNGVAKYEDNELKIIAIMHDLIEDTYWTFELLEELNNPPSPRVMAALRLVTKTGYLTYQEEMERIITNQDAIKVKMADLKHNSTPFRMNNLKDRDLERIKKYNDSYFFIKQYLK